uniref:MalT-like TPR region domain-containing protein n=1 Tax=Odontella aurita TaxID=265563 RepID=A0A7S4NCL2_9STRA|mmetsp:Transcript_57576/g.171690  ORF Transcript_57576/g.171690 Transcript_57576/m.171690 type:complete len:523 (+) Transcript_57576:269-1837(+)
MNPTNDRIPATSTCIDMKASTCSLEIALSSSSNPSSMNDLGMSRYLSGDIEAAMICFDRALKMQIESEKNDRGDLYSSHAPAPRRRLDVPEPRREVDADSDSRLIGMGRFVTPLSVDACQDEDDKRNITTAVLLYNISLVKLSQSQYQVVIDLLDLALRELDQGTSCRDEGRGNDWKPSSPHLRLMILTNLGMALYRLGNFEDAANLFDEASAIPEHLLQEVERTYDAPLVVRERTSRLVKSILTCLAYSLLNGARARGASNDWRSSEALDMVHEASDICGTIQSCSGDARADISSGSAYVEAAIRHRRGELKIAEEHYRLGADRASAAGMPLRAAAALNGMGRVLFERRRLPDSIAPLRTAWSTFASRLGEDHPVSIDALYVLGRAYHDLEEMPDALSVYERTYSLQKRVYGADNIGSLRTLCNVARIRRMSGMGAEALEACKETVEVARKSLGDSHPFVLDMISMRGKILHEMGRVEEASEFIDVSQFLVGGGERKAKDLFSDCTSEPCISGRSPGAAAA